MAYGREVDSGDTIAELSNPGMSLEKLKLIGQRNELKVLLRELKNQTAGEKTALSATEQRLVTIEEQIELHRENIEQLKIISGEAGVLQRPESILKSNSVFELGEWQDVPLQKSNKGAYLERGTILGYIGKIKMRRVVAYVDERDVRNVQRGADITVLGLDGSQESYNAKLTDFARISTSQIHPAMDVAGMNTWDRQNSGQTVTRISATIEADTVPAFYSVGKVKLIGRKTSLWQKLMSYLRSEFSAVFG